MRHPSGVGYTDRAPVGVGVQCDRDVGVDVGGQLQQRVDGAGSSGLGNGTVGKSGSGANWLSTTCTSVRPARTSASQRELAAHPVQRRQRHPHRFRRVPDVGRAIDVALDLVDTRRFDGLARAISSAWGACAMAASISRSVGGTIGNPPSK